jgi:dihydroxy-acid dehydratase
MEDFHRAGGLPVLLKELMPLLEVDAQTVTGEALETVLERVTPAATWQTAIRTLEKPLQQAAGLRVLRGSLAPDGAVLKASAASPHLLKHIGPAVVVNGLEQLDRLDEPDLEVTADSVLVLQNAGPVASGMPEAGYLPIPRKLAEAGVKDMVRVSDARMSGTAFGTVVLHCSPEAAVGGTLGLVVDGDQIALDARAGTIELLVDQNELDRRRASVAPPDLPKRGWKALHARHVLQAHDGADFDFLTADRSTSVSESSRRRARDGLSQLPR